MRRRWLPLLAAVLAPVSGTAAAHSFGRMYTLPVPVWLYLYGAAAALVASFIVVAWFIRLQPAQGRVPARDGREAPGARLWNSAAALGALRGLSVAALALTVAAGLLGTQDSYANIGMTLFWIVFALGFAYLTALIGDVYAAINPWRVVCDWIERLRPGAFRGRVAYPERMGYWPALALYMAFIWIELFGHARPRSLAWILIAYTVLNLAAAWLVGRRAWFRHGEFFGVFLRLLAMMAPLEWVCDADGQRALRLRPPFAGLLRERAESFSLLLFVLFMLSSTAFDGLRETVPWVRLFWTDLYGALLQPLLGGDPIRAFPALLKIYRVYQSAALALSPFFYLALYALFVWLAKLATRSAVPLRELLLRFGYSLIPIAFVYNITHYYTLVLTQGTQIVRLASDPFGRGWNLLGTARWTNMPVVEAGTVWHTQVALIVLGHVVGVYLAHVEALRLFRDSRSAALSQLPMLLMMVAFTTIGLWILSLPLQAGSPLSG